MLHDLDTCGLEHFRQFEQRQTDQRIGVIAAHTPEQAGAITLGLEATGTLVRFLHAQVMIELVIIELPKFNFEWRYLALGVPSKASLLTPEIYDREKQKDAG